MADPTTAIPQAVAPYEALTLKIADTVAMVTGQLAAIRGPSNATSQGVADKYAANVNGLLFVGLNHNDETGDASATPPPMARLQVHPFLLKGVTVAGVTAGSDVLANVYAADSNTNTALTLTRPAKGQRIGVIVRHYVGDICDVLVLGILDGLIGKDGGKELLHLGTVVTELAAAGDLLTGIVAPFHGKVTGIYAICASAPTDPNMNMDVTLDIGGTNVTGGVVNLNFADTVGLKKAGTAITAANEFHEGDLLDIEALAAGFVAGTAKDGFYNIYLEVERLPGA